jgi:hypothetical protein
MLINPHSCWAYPSMMCLIIRISSGAVLATAKHKINFIETFFLRCILVWSELLVLTNYFFSILGATTFC